MSLARHLALVSRDSRARQSVTQRCGLCGKARQVIKTECCDNWVCFNAADLLSRKSCLGRHSRYTLCSYHRNEGHRGSWTDCKRCRDAFETEIYVWYGTNEHNFEKLVNPPAFEPTLCTRCRKRINLGAGGYSTDDDGYACDECTEKLMAGEFDDGAEGKPRGLSRSPGRSKKRSRRR